jgi:hypothetical protein
MSAGLGPVPHAMVAASTVDIASTPTVTDPHVRSSRPVTGASRIDTFGAAVRGTSCYQRCERPAGQGPLALVTRDE